MTYIDEHECWWWCVYGGVVVVVPALLFSLLLDCHLCFFCRSVFVSWRFSVPLVSCSYIVSSYACLQLCLRPCRLQRQEPQKTKQARNPKHPNSLEWHNKTITKVVSTTFSNTLIEVMKDNDRPVTSESSYKETQ